MSKRYDQKLRDDIRQMITEVLNDGAKFDGTEIFKISPYLHQLLGEATKNPDLMVLVNKYEDMAQSDINPVFYIADFAAEIAPYATGNRTIKDILKSVENVINTNKYQYETFRIILSLPDEIDYIKEAILDRYNFFLYDPNEESKARVLEEIDALYGINNELEDIAMKLTLLINEAVELPTVNFDSTSIYESAVIKNTKAAAEYRQKRLMEDAYNKVMRYLDEREKEENAQEQQINETYSLQGIANKNGLKLYDRINEVIKSDAIKNATLKNILSQYSQALKEGAFEERLYETLLHNTAKFDYLLPVERMRNAILEVAKKKNDEITLTKILEEMIASPTSYIYVDIIQEDVARYVLDPSDVNRVQLRNALTPFAADPYIGKMFEVIFFDDQKRNPVGGEIERQTLNITEQIDLIRQNARVEPIFSPVQYIKEGESIFNVHGQYYVRKNNSIALLEKKYIAKLDRKFVELCHLVNDPHVHIFEDRIEVRGIEHTATVYEGYVEIAGYHEDKESLRRLDEMYIKYDNYDNNFFVMCSCLLENFNKIANVNWAKRIVLNENNRICADLFKLDENVSIALHNYDVNTHTLYRGVNPIWCRNTLNEHMGLNVAYLFEDMLPDQKKIMLKLYETKNEYEESIEKYEKAIQDLKDAKADTNDESLIDELDKSIEDSEKKLKEIKDEYKEWQKAAEETTKSDMGSEDDEADNIEQQKGNEPIDKEEVDQHKDELTKPISQTEEPIGDTISDEKFDDILAGKDTVSDEEDIIDTDNYGDVAITDVDTVVNQEPADNTAADDDSIFDDEPVADQEITNDLEDGDVADAEDIIQYGDDFDDMPQEAPDMEVIDHNSEAGIDATDIFGGDIDNPLNDNSEEVEINNFYNPNIQTDEYSIVNVMFDQNVMTGVVQKSGQVTVLQTVVDNNGKQISITKNYNFLMDGENNKIVLDIDPTETMSTGLYKAIMKSIQSHPTYDEVIANGLPGEPFQQDLTYKDSDLDISSVDDLLDKPAEEDVFTDDVIDTDNYGDVIPGTDVKATFAFDDEDEYNSIFGKDFDDEETEKVTVDVPVPVEVPVASEDDYIEITPEDREIEDFEIDDILAGKTPAPRADVDDDDDDYGFEDIISSEEGEEIDPVQTYVKDETEIEYPADNVDDSVIPESKQNKGGNRVNENRSKIVSIKKVKK